MKVSELTVDTFADYARLDAEEENLEPFLEAAISYVKAYAGLDDEQMDAHPEISICCMAVASDLYDQRQTSVNVQSSYINKLIDSMLFMHSTNLL